MIDRKTVPLKPGEKSEIKLQFLIDPFRPGEELPKHARPGERCPVCGQGILDYDGMLNLVCPVCNFIEGGCFT